ncbi:hypothetical protein [Companilactobacillus metriopterae]|uniref:hypothetical protein n=1 Tax=Companilactobacillus metriopterae TaxID=1909267 RepID=UPI00100B3D85|nr:hypothetical protein [Companilactobacillus metriopterae]
MKLQDFYKLLTAEVDLPISYFQFKKGESPSLPYLIYYQISNNPTYADNKNYFDDSDVNVELYTNKKDLVSEKKITDFFCAHDITYQSFETYIEDEKMYQVLYQITI